jgi:hypothetical protein
MDTPKFEGWCVVEVMGHNSYAGFASEVVVAGGSFLRVDVPEVEGRPAFTKILGTASIFAITPCDEAVARKAARYQQPAIQLALPAPVPRQRDMYDEDFDDA